MLLALLVPLLSRRLVCPIGDSDQCCQCCDCWIRETVAAAEVGEEGCKARSASSTILLTSDVIFLWATLVRLQRVPGAGLRSRCAWAPRTDYCPRETPEFVMGSGTSRLDWAAEMMTMMPRLSPVPHGWITVMD